MCQKVSLICNQHPSQRQTKEVALCRLQGVLLRRRKNEGVERQHEWAVLEFETKDAMKLAEEGIQTPHNQDQTHIQEDPLHSQSDTQGSKSEEQGASQQGRKCRSAFKRSNSTSRLSQLSRRSETLSTL